MEDFSWRAGSVEKRLTHSVTQGTVDYLEQDLVEARGQYRRPLQIVEGPLRNAMESVADRYGADQIFLSQVIKSARVFKQALAYLEPFIETEEERTAAAQAQGKVLLATVKGDIYDIGKHIIRVVLECHNYRIIDLGVAVPADEILNAAIEEEVDIIGLSGLITPSLHEMQGVAKEMQRRAFELPLMIGGAATTKQHTAIKIAPHYEHTTIHVLNVSHVVGVVSSLLDDGRRQAFKEQNRQLQKELRHIYGERWGKPLLPYEAAQANRLSFPWRAEDLAQPSFLGRQVLADFPLDELVAYIDWTFFFTAWGLKGRYPQVLDHPEYGEAARDLFGDAQKMLDRIVSRKLVQANAVWGFWPANSIGDDIVLYTDRSRNKELMRFSMLRQQEVKPDDDKPHRSLADFVAPRETGLLDHLGAFAATSGLGVEELVKRYETERDDFGAIMVKALADRLAEAFAELLHHRARKAWGYGHNENLSQGDLIAEKYLGIRPAFGYPASPDHTEKGKLWELLDAEAATSLRLTEHYAMVPEAAVSGIYLAHPLARYFQVGRIGRDQVQDYAARKKMAVEEVEKWLTLNLGYDPEA